MTRPGNLARLNAEKSKTVEREQIEKLAQVQLNGRKNVEKIVEEYKQSLIDNYDRKKATQQELSSYLKMQMELNQTKMK